MNNKDLGFEMMYEKDGEYLLLRCDGVKENGEYHLFETKIDLDENVYFNDDYNTDCSMFLNTERLPLFVDTYKVKGFNQVPFHIEECSNGRFYRID